MLYGLFVFCVVDSNVVVLLLLLIPQVCRIANELQELWDGCTMLLDLRAAERICAQLMLYSLALLALVAPTDAISWTKGTTGTCAGISDPCTGAAQCTAAVRSHQPEHAPLSDGPWEPSGATRDPQGRSQHYVKSPRWSNEARHVGFTGCKIAHHRARVARCLESYMSSPDGTVMTYGPNTWSSHSSSSVGEVQGALSSDHCAGGVALRFLSLAP